MPRFWGRSRRVWPVSVHDKAQSEASPGGCLAGVGGIDGDRRAVLQSELLGETVHSFHETLNVPRLVAPIVQAMLPWRMPRRR